MDSRERLVLITMIAIIAAVLVALPFLIKNQLDFEKQCRMSGGTPIRQNCVDNHVLIPLGESR